VCEKISPNLLLGPAASLTVFIILYVLESPCGCQQITAKSQFTSAVLLHVAHYDYYYYYYCYTRLVASFP